MPGHSTRQATATMSVLFFSFLLPVLQWGVLNSLNNAEGCQCWCAPETLSMELKGYLFEQGKDNFILISSIFVISYFPLLCWCVMGLWHLADLVTVWPFSTCHFFSQLWRHTKKLEPECVMSRLEQFDLWLRRKGKRDQSSCCTVLGHEGLTTIV